MTCALGVENVGLVLITHGVVDAICSYGFGQVMKFTGRAPIFVMGALINYVLMAVMFLWAPRPGAEWAFYVVAALWGMADAVWQTQINGTFSCFDFLLQNAVLSSYRTSERLQCSKIVF